jgi:hypothetical protein
MKRSNRKAKRDNARVKRQSTALWVDDLAKRASSRQLVLHWLAANANKFALFRVQKTFYTCHLDLVGKPIARISY